MKKLLKIFPVFVALVGTVIICFILFVAFCTPTGADHDRVNSFARTLEQRYSFSAHRTDGRDPSVYTTPSPFGDYISIYGDYSNSEIRTIESVARQIQSNRIEKKKVFLSFYRIELDEQSIYHRTTIK
ncbi:MAG: hypothetical protein GX811_06780 [Lentisphaerae bacterium]|nr:hypothetical protein [Lentisphaerota bacterium]